MPCNINTLQLLIEFFECDKDVNNNIVRLQLYNSSCSVDDKDLF